MKKTLFSFLPGFLLLMLFSIGMFGQAYAAAPNAPVLWHPKNNGVVDTANPTLYAYYLDDDANGTVEFRVSSGSLANCTAGDFIEDTGSSAVSGSTNEVVSYTVTNALADTGTYSWCARGNDGTDQSAWTEMGQFTVYLTDTLIASTLFAETGSTDDNAEMIGEDPDGNVVIFSRTDSWVFPTTAGVLQEVNPQPGYEQSAISVLSPDLTTLIRSTYVGATDEDMILKSGAIDENGYFYIAGNSYATTVPQPAVPNGIKTTIDDNNGDVFLIKLSADLSTVLYTTFIGSDNDYEYQEKPGIAVHPTNQQVVVTGITWATDFPTTANAFDSTNTDFDDGFVAVIDTSVSGLPGRIYQSYVGGNGYDQMSAPDYHTNGHIYLSLYTCATDFPLLTAGSFKPAVDPGGSCDAVVIELDPLGTSVTSLVYGTAIGGTGHEEIYNVVVDNNDDVYVCGYTRSNDLTMHINAYDATQEVGGSYDAFFYKLSLDGTGAGDLLGSTYLHGSDDRVEVCNDLDVDPQGDVVFVAQVGSGTPTTANAFQAVGTASPDDVYVGKFSSDFSDLLYGSYYDCQCFTDVTSAAIFDTGVMYAAGYHNGLGVFPTTPGAYLEVRDGWEDVFVGAFVMPFDPIIPGPYVFPAAPPNAPVISVIPGDGELQVTFSAPANNGSAITQYEIRYGVSGVGFPGNEVTVVQAAGADPVTVVIGGLDNGVEYSVRVFAENGNGLSAASNVENGIPVAGSSGRRINRQQSATAPWLFFGSFREVLSPSSQELRGSAPSSLGMGLSGESSDDSSWWTQSRFLEDNSADSFQRSFRNDPSYSEAVGEEGYEALSLLDLVLQLRRLFSWMQQEDVQMLSKYEQLSDEYHDFFLSRYFHRLVGHEYLRRSNIGSYGFDYREELSTPTNIVVDFEKSVFLTFGRSCYEPETLSYAEELDAAGNDRWYVRYREFMKPWTDELLGMTEYVPWYPVGASVDDVLEALYFYLYGFCLPRFL